MSSMINGPDVPGNDLFTLARVRAIDEREEGLVELEIIVDCGPESPWGDQPGEHPWFLRFHHRVLGLRGPSASGTLGPDGRMTIAVPRGEIEGFIRAVRQAARDANAAFQDFLAQQREQAEREAHGEPAKRARLAEDQARIDAVLAETDESG
jgi:hypothetical protein